MIVIIETIGHGYEIETDEFLRMYKTLEKFLTNQLKMQHIQINGSTSQNNFHTIGNTNVNNISQNQIN